MAQRNIMFLMFIAMVATKEVLIISSASKQQTLKKMIKLYY